MRRTLAEALEIIVDGALQTVLDAPITWSVLLARACNDVASELGLLSVYACELLA